MFKKKNRKETPNPDQTDTLVGQETVMEGVLRSQSSIRIEGQFKGDIQCEGDCVIGEKGSAETSIHARNISIAGKVTGNMYADGTLTILSTGTLLGDCHATTLIIEEGGTFNGRSAMNDNNEAISVDSERATDDRYDEAATEAMS